MRIDARPRPYTRCFYPSATDIFIRQSIGAVAIDEGLGTRRGTQTQNAHKATHVVYVDYGHAAQIPLPSGLGIKKKTFT